MISIDDPNDELYTEATLIKTIENQIEADDPPAARSSFIMLSLVGYSKQEILQMMALVLAAEIATLLQANRPFDRKGYEKSLRRLPRLPRSVRLA